jgi:hypothetical protein
MQAVSRFLANALLVSVQSGWIVAVTFLFDGWFSTILRNVDSSIALDNVAMNFLILLSTPLHELQ